MTTEPSRPDRLINPREGMDLPWQQEEQQLFAAADDLLEEAYGTLLQACRWSWGDRNAAEGAISYIVDWINQYRPPAADRYRKQPIPKALRWAVWERDNFTCRHCGARRDLAADHIVPESKGGQTTLDNLQTLCVPCNSRKGARQ